jgi:hypothetical protein
MKNFLCISKSENLTQEFALPIQLNRECLTPDPILQCSIYEIQTTENTRWYRVYPISLIDSLPKVHFVHPHVLLIHMTYLIINI